MSANQTDVLIGISERLLPLSEKRFGKMSPAEQTFWLVWQMLSEVNNGGFNQFYFNSSGDRSIATPAALRTIGAKKFAGIMERANALFPGGRPPEHRYKRQTVLEEIDPETELFDDLDEEVYAYPENVDRLLYEFVLRNRESIRGV
jgi:hypothetical protein